MKRFVVIATRSSELQRRVKKALASIGHKGDLFVATSHDELLIQMFRGAETLVLVDKFFLGFNLSIAVNFLKGVNPDVRIAVLSDNDNSKYFGYRLYKNGLDGFFWNCGNEAAFQRALEAFFLKGRYYPRQILDGIENGDYENSREYSGELSPSELGVLLQRMKGISFKEIPNIEDRNARRMYLRAKRKLGLESVVDYLRFAGELGFRKPEKGELIDIG